MIKRQEPGRLFRNLPRLVLVHISLGLCQGKWLAQVARGYFAYHAVQTNARSLGAFLHYVKRLWKRALRRRSQKDGTKWARIAKLAADLSADTPRPSSLAG